MDNLGIPPSGRFGPMSGCILLEETLRSLSPEGFYHLPSFLQDRDYGLVLASPRFLFGRDNILQR